MDANPEERWLVYVADGGEVSRCVPADQPIPDALETEGLRLVWDAAPSRLEGWSYAAIAHGCIPDDYDDRMKPCAFFRPTVLFRSVSLAEMDDIVRTGSVSGGGNGFNGFDRRPFVFFSPSPTERCIGQGEEVDRAAAQAVVKAHGTAPFEGKDGHETFMELYREERRRLAEELKDAEFTSAVIRTRAVAPGLHYSREHGSSGMGEEDEYALFPRQVKLPDVEEVLLVRNGRIVRSCAVPEACEALGLPQAEEAGDACEASEPRP